jgi:hypothetical protein
MIFSAPNFLVMAHYRSTAEPPSLELTKQQLMIDLPETKGTFGMPGTADKLLRALFLAENIRENEDRVILQKLLVSVMDELDQIDEVIPRQAKFELEESRQEARWQEAA